jgi:hypothetical protein
VRAALTTFSNDVARTSFFLLSQSWTLGRCFTNPPSTRGSRAERAKFALNDQLNSLAKTAIQFGVAGL